MTIQSISTPHQGTAKEGEGRAYFQKCFFSLWLIDNILLQILLLQMKPHMITFSVKMKELALIRVDVGVD